MKLGLFGGGFKPFTTGHFSKLADAIRDNDKVILFYGMQQQEPVRYGKRGKPRKSQQKFRSIGDTKRTYDENIAQSIFEIYRVALERIPEIEVVPILSQAVNAQGEPASVRAPVTAIFKVLEEFAEDPSMYEKVTIYGDRSSLRPYLRSAMFKDLAELGKIQFGGAIPDSHSEYLDSDMLDRLMARGAEEARSALRTYYPDLEVKDGDSEEEIQRKLDDLERMQSVRGTEVRRMASSLDTVDQAKRYLPPFLNDSEKDSIIQILMGEEQPALQDQPQENLEEVYLRSFIRGIIRG